MNLLIDLADIEGQLAGGGCERIQLGSLVASFCQGYRVK